MGVARYGNEDYRFDDRVLAHLQTVIGMQLRRRESFILGWTDSPAGVRQSLWVDTGIPIRFSFEDDANHALNRHWIADLIDASRRPAGVLLGDEPAAVASVATPVKSRPSAAAAAPRAARPAAAPYVRTAAVYAG